MTSWSSFFLLPFIGGFILLQVGFVIREVGVVRIKDRKKLIIRHLVNLLLSGVVYFLFGYILTSSNGGAADKFIGTTYDYPDELMLYLYIFFHSLFASITSSIVAGALAERCKLISHFVYCVFISGLIHPVVRYWTVYGRGWLTNGYKDNAGSGAIHVVAGMTALLGAIMLGPRTGRFDPSLIKDTTYRCHSVRIVAIGGFVLLLGFWAFICGCKILFALEFPNDPIAVSTVNPLVSGFIAAFTSLLINRYSKGKWSLLVAINGALTGMVAISGGSDDLEWYAAAVVGLIAAIVYKFFSVLLVRFGIDDPLDVVAVHFGGGSWGLISVAFFHKTKGLFQRLRRQSVSMLGWQFLGLVAIAIWTAVLSVLMFGMLKCFGILRVCDEVQEKAGFENPAYELKEIEKDNVETVDITVNASPEKICQKETYIVSDNVGDVHL